MKNYFSKAKLSIQKIIFKIKQLQTQQIIKLFNDKYHKILEFNRKVNSFFSYKYFMFIYFIY